jgi:hypothetical protein
MALAVGKDIDYVLISWFEFSIDGKILLGEVSSRESKRD